MLTVLESINLSTDYLNKKGIESPKLNAELLLAHILKCKRLDLYLSFDRPLKKEEIDEYRELLKRRSAYEPLQYILGEVECYGLKFKVNSSVLIPRPETELLVENVIDSFDKNAELKILDIGTGSGIIAVTLAKYLSASCITAIDISEAALTLANENAEINGVKERINFITWDIMSDNIFPDKFDIIVSNPPYISVNDYEELKPELKVYEPRIALTDNSDGLNFYRKIISSSKNNLITKGKIFLEIGMGQSEQVKLIMAENNYTNISVRKDFQGIDRVISGELK